MSPTASVHGPAERQTLPWPDTPDARNVRGYWTRFLAEGTRSMISNVDVTPWVAVVGPHALPLTIGRPRASHAFVASTWAQYVGYAREELGKVDAWTMRASLRPLIALLDRVTTWGEVDRAVHVDNWLLSTNLHPHLTDPELDALTSALVRTWPDRAVIWRSVRGDAAELARWRAHGFQLIPSRSIWIWDPADPAQARSRDLDRDATLLDDGLFSIRELLRAGRHELERLAELYRGLYLRKYSRRNPHFTRHFMDHVVHSSNFSTYVLEQDGRAFGVIGFYERNGWMTTPVLGYDLARPQEEGLYRRLSALLIRESRKRGLLLHQSAGAGRFKRNRRCRNEVEYLAVHHRHLSLRRRLPWLLLGQAARRIALPLVQRAEL